MNSAIAASVTTQQASRSAVAGDARLIWGDVAVVAVAIPFFAGVVSLLLVALLRMW